VARLKDLIHKPEILSPGHRMCPGCGAPIAVRQVLMALDDPVVVCCATGCLEVSTTIYPYTAWRSPFIHNAFENAAATISGVEAAYLSLKKQGKVDKEIKFVAFGGDGGTYDIGLQSLSGAMERGHNMVYVCYDNGAYMNTGIQRSSATPRGADTTTSPAGKVIPGKPAARKDLTAIMAAHNIPYVAQASPSHWNDLVEKAKKAFAVEGPAFLNILAPCPRGWRYDAKDTIEMSRLAVDTCQWPLYEIEDGVLRITYQPKEKKPLTDYLKPQGRFKHLFAKGNEQLLEELQAEVDKRWEELKQRAACQEAK
jgi:pyruvate ferredoxin oxidoreductase beta subunit